MILPNKLIPFSDSVLAKVSHLLKVLVISDETIASLYEKTEQYFEDVNQYILALDVLFVLERVKLNYETKVVTYVKHDNM